MGGKIRIEATRTPNLVAVIIAACAIMAGNLVAHEARGNDDAAAAARATPGMSRPQSGYSVPAPAVLLMLVRTTLVALNQANFTGNYAVLHALGTPQLQLRSSPAQLAIAFTDLRDRKLDLSPVLVLSPELTKPPRLADDGKLRLAGFFRTRPLRLSFVMEFKPVAGVWRIEGLTVATSLAPAEVAGTKVANPDAKPANKER